MTLDYIIDHTSATNDVEETAPFIRSDEPLLSENDMTSTPTKT